MLKKDKRVFTKGVFPLLGLNCASCAARAERIVGGLEGVEHASVNFAAANVMISYDPNHISVQQIRKAVADAGYDLVMGDTEEASREQAKEYARLKRDTVLAVCFALPVMVIGMLFMHMPYADFILWGFSTPVIFLFGGQFFRNARRQLKRMDFGMDTLVALSTSIAYVFSVFNTVYPEFWLSRGITPHVYYEAAAVIIAFILLGRLLEARARSNASDALKKLIGLQPKTVTVIRTRGGEERAEHISLTGVVAGDVLLVKPGEKIAADGVVLQGESYVDESMLSGEPLPVLKIAGEKVFAGTVNRNGSFRFRAEEVAGETLLSHIIAMVQQAQGSKAPVQKLVDKIAGIFVPVVMGVALLAGTGWFVFGGEYGVTYGLLAMVTVLVIACPCALGLATPTAIMVGIGRGAQNGILIKDAVSLEIAKSVNAVVLDKTGTVTEGKPVVTDVVWGEHIPDTALERCYPDVIYSLEKQSEHPLAEAVCNFFERDKNVLAIENFRSITGKGVEGVISGVKYLIGSDRLLKDYDLVPDASLSERAESLRRGAKSIIWFVSGREVVALFAVSDKIKATSRQAVRLLKQSGIEVYMVTGDNEGTARYVAREAGIKHFRASALPEDKAIFVNELQAAGKVVAMVGDGINDSAAMAQANLGIAMGKGSDIAMEVAQMTIISSDLMKIPQAIRLSALTVKTIRQNLFWAFIYNVIGIPLAAGILYPVNGFLLNPMIAGAAMALSSVSVVLNSLFLGYKAGKSLKKQELSI